MTDFNAGYDSRDSEIELLEAQIKDLLFDDTQNFKNLKTENVKLKELIKELKKESKFYKDLENE
jgi:cell shape-determining protein MreC